MEAQARHEFYEFIREEWGPTRAGQLMDLLPPFDWSEVATKSDLRVLGAELRQEMAELRAELRVEMHDGFRHFAEALATHTRTIVLAMIALWISGIAFAVTAARLAA